MKVEFPCRWPEGRERTDRSNMEMAAAQLRLRARKAQASPLGDVRYGEVGR